MTSFRRIMYGSDAYRAMLDLRREMLRLPLGLELMEADTAGEQDEHLVAAFEGERMIGCVVLRPLADGAVQLRQMAVRNDHQGRGVGSALVAFAETLARDEGFRRIVIHARTTATGFYEKAGYRVEGGQFLEIGIPHLRLEKEL
jgi:GNAT superfamily N-acetyltransferase